MPGKIRVKIIAGRNLPIMDRSSDTTDAYVEIKLGSDTFKTDVYRKSLHPQWNTDWFRFEVSDYLIIRYLGTLKIQTSATLSPIFMRNKGHILCYNSSTMRNSKMNHYKFA